MGKKESYESRVEAYLLPLMEEHHFELVDVEYVKEAGTWYLRAYIDKEGGIAVDDCEVISRKLGDWLDKEDFISESYILEVCSAGLTRALKRPGDFEKFLGHLVTVKLYVPKAGAKEHVGELRRYDQGAVEISQGGELLRFEKSEIAGVWLYMEI